MFFTDFVEFAGIPGYALVARGLRGGRIRRGRVFAGESTASSRKLLPAEKLVAANGWIED